MENVIDIPRATLDLENGDLFLSIHEEGAPIRSDVHSLVDAQVADGPHHDTLDAKLGLALAGVPEHDPAVVRHFGNARRVALLFFSVWRGETSAHVGVGGATFENGLVL